MKDADAVVVAEVILDVVAIAEVARAEAQAVAGAADVAGY